MKSHARVVVIGGGAVGVATLYQLTRKGWSDVVLVERKELTSGSTWHAAGLLPLFNMSYSVGQIHKYSVALYQRLQEETGQDVGLRQCSNIRLALNRDRMDEYHQYAGVAETIGITVEFLTPQQVKELWPLCNIEGVVGAIRHPEDGYVQPADVTQAMARGARAGGAEVYRQTRVVGIERKPSGEWLVRTDKGEITCEHVVSATGNFARQTGAMVGLDVPVIPVEHQYIVTEPHPAIVQRHKDGLPEMGVLRESDGSWYMREEAGGLLLGPYEKGAPCCYVDGPHEDAEYELFPDDLERLTPHIEAAINRVPAFGEVGVKQVYNGAIPYTPDGSPIIGPAWGLRNFWLNEGHSFGITAAGEVRLHQGAVDIGHASELHTGKLPVDARVMAAHVADAQNPCLERGLGGPHPDHSLTVDTTCSSSRADSPGWTGSESTSSAACSATGNEASPERWGGARWMGVR
jgi:dimethylglycine dehydrogenase